MTDEEPCYAVAGADVEILVQSGRAAGQEHGSSRVKLKNIVDYKWEVKKYHGRLIAVHRDAQVIAYSIKLKTGAGVRVVWNGERALIKGMANEVLDLQFAHMSSKIILACVDESSLHVYRVDTSPGKLDTALLLRVDSAVEDVPLSTHRINWCPFVPSATPTQQTTTAMDISATGGSGAAGAAEEEVDGSEEDFANHLLVWIQGDTFQALNIHLVVEGHGTGTFDYAELSEGVVQHRESKATITVATFSPDGTTLAVGYEDGNVYFYQMYLYSKETTPRRLYHWRPHDNKPVSALAFLDDHTVVRPSEAGGSFWKHALTATDHNTEIKLWRCDDWSCIQRICFKPTAFDSRLDFKLDIDASSSYLVLSEQTNRVLYALQIARPQQQQQGEGGDAVATSTVAFKAVAEFPLSSSILSFGIAGATKGKYQCGRLQDDDLDEYEQEEADADPMVGAMIQMFLVQPKSVQECQVFFQTETAGRDMDISLEVSPGVAATDLTQHFYSPVAGGTGATSAATAAAGRQKSSAQINLMTPESFQSPPQQSDQGVSSSVLTTIRMLAASATADTPITPESMLSYAVLEERNKALRKSLAAAGDQPSSTTLDPLPIASSTVNTSEILPSGNSSPSREVQEILSLKDEMFENHLQSSDLDMELEVNSSGGTGTEVDEDDDEEEEDEEEETVGEVAATNNNVNLTTTTTTATTTTKKKVLDGIASIKLYVDDDEEDNNETGAEEGGVGSDKTTEISSSSNLEWPKVPNILPDMARIAAPELNNLNGGSNSGVECKLDRILDQLGALERRFAQLEQQQQQPPPSQYTDKLAVTLDRHIKSCELVMKHELEAVLKRQTEAMRETVLQAMQQQQQQVKERATGNLLAELRPQLMALVARELENIKGMLQYEVANKLSTSDQLLRENLNYVCTNKSLMESFAAAIRSGVQHTVQVTFMEQINKLIVPAYERATKEMFKQTNDMFQKGVVNCEWGQGVGRVGVE